MFQQLQNKKILPAEKQDFCMLVCVLKFSFTPNLNCTNPIKFLVQDTKFSSFSLQKKKTF